MNATDLLELDKVPAYLNVVNVSNSNSGKNFLLQFSIKRPSENWLFKP
jgi:hypothetical protein